MKEVIHIPKELNTHSALKSWGGVALTLAIFYGSVAVIAVAWSLGNFWVAAPIILIAMIAGGYSMLNIGFMGHDGFHFSLHPNKLVSCSIGVISNSFIYFSAVGFAVSHWNHHKHTNGSEDPDVQIFARFQTFWERLLFARPYAYYVYFMNSWQLATGKPLPFNYAFPLPYKQMQWFARANIFLSALCLFVTLVVFVKFPFLVIPFCLVLVSGSLISGLSPYVEHTNTVHGRGFDSRSSAGWLRDITMMKNNYHLEHHLYPTIPAYNLKKVHKYLRSQGYYDTERPLTHGYWQAFRTTFSDHKYPS